MPDYFAMAHERKQHAEQEVERQRQRDRGIAQMTAEIYADKDWHQLSTEERELIELLEKGGWIRPNEPRNGFVGKAQAI